MQYAIEGFMKQIAGDLIPTLCAQKALQGEMTWTAWRTAVQNALLDSIGGIPKAVPLDLQTVEDVQKEGYRRQKVQYVSEKGLLTPAYVLIPDGATKQTSTVIAIHGHGFGVKDIVGLAEDGSEQITPSYQKAFAVSLVKKGFVTIAPELFGFGELRLQEDIQAHPNTSSCFRTGTALLHVGRSLASVRVTQCMRAIDLIDALPVGSPVRVGSMGISGGGLVSSFLAILDERIKTCVVSGYACTFEDSILAVHHCVDNYFFGLLKKCELPDLLCAIAPRPMLWESGLQDNIFPIHGVQKAAAQVKEAYQAQNAASCFEMDVFEGDHQISGARALDFIAEHL